MDVKWPKAGKYVVAVSGGVDSAALLNLLHERGDYELVVAHFDHGIRPDSHIDLEFVKDLADSLNLQFVGAEGKLGPDASEATAREARYEFLRKAMRKAEAQAIITAHHQDDLIETAILNMLRGTGRKGLVSLSERSDILRPLLEARKQELIDYAQKNSLEWREDSTNQNDKYSRNYVRHNLIPKLSEAERQTLLRVLAKLKETSWDLDTLLVKYTQNAWLDRAWFNSLPHDVAKEVMAAWLRNNEIRDFDRKNIESLVVASKTAKVGKQFPVLKMKYMQINQHNLALVVHER
jgi:tRNA(Ile)-lysidine synthetase-like protein